MNRMLKRGNSTAEGVIILAILIVIAFLAPKDGSNTSTRSTTSGGSNLSQGEVSLLSRESPHATNISLNTGNARYSYQPNEEYITIRNSGREAINITNWQIKNGKGERTYYLGGNLQRFPSDVAMIPQGALVLSPTVQNIMRDIILEPGENAIITTGNVASQAPHRVVSFKENICSGYLENMAEYSFTPSLNRNCPHPGDEVGLEWLDTECRTFVRNMQSCRVPEFETRNRDGSICHNCVDGKLLSSACVAFVKNHFNYSSCVTNHQYNENFSERTWRIFLGKGWEMWAKEYEKISLFDQFGRLVTEVSY